MQKEISAYLGQISKASLRADCILLTRMIEEETGHKARLQGRIVSFGASFVIGFLPRTQDISIYIVSEPEVIEQELARLGKYKRSKCCLYLNKLADVDSNVLRKLISKSVRAVENAA